MLFQAAEAEWDIAFERALEIGRGMQRSYLNDKREEVAWHLGGVRTLDQLGAEITEGQGIYFAARPVSSPDLRVADLRPDEVCPTQSGV